MTNLIRAIHIIKIYIHGPHAIGSGQRGPQIIISTVIEATCTFIKR